MNKSADRIYLKEFMIAMIAYVVVLVVSVSLLKISPSSAWWRFPLAVTPVVPALFGVLAFVRWMGRIDELQRRIQLEALAFAFGGVSILTFSYGFLEGVGFPHLSWVWILPLMIVLWSFGNFIASRRYR